MRTEYDFSKAARGKYAARANAASNVVLLETDVATAFPNSAAVNAALRTLIKAAKNVAFQP